MNIATVLYYLSPILASLVMLGGGIYLRIKSNSLSFNKKAVNMGSNKLVLKYNEASKDVQIRIAKSLVDGIAESMIYSYHIPEMQAEINDNLREKLVKSMKAPHKAKVKYSPESSFSEHFADSFS
jgi:hypothetical protein